MILDSIKLQHSKLIYYYLISLLMQTHGLARSQASNTNSSEHLFLSAEVWLLCCVFLLHTDCEFVYVFKTLC